MADTRAADLLYNALVTKARQEEWVNVDLEPVPTDGIDRPLPTGDRELRGQVRLLIQAVVVAKLDDANEREFVNDVIRVPWCSSQRLASRATNRFLEIAGWAGREFGEESASSWESAARLPEWLMEDYSGWPHRESFIDVAEWYLSALRCGGWNERIFLDLLNALKTKES